MQLFGPSGARADPIDRNPTRISVGGGGTLAGGQDIVQATYTTPANRRALITVVSMHGVVTVALAAAQTAKFRIEHGVAGVVVGAIMWQAAAAVGTRDRADLSYYYLAAGETLRVRTTLAAGAGTMEVEGGLDGIEYDT